MAAAHRLLPTHEGTEAQKRLGVCQGSAGSRDGTREPLLRAGSRTEIKGPQENSSLVPLTQPPLVTHDVHAGKRHQRRAAPAPRGK